MYVILSAPCCNEELGSSWNRVGKKLNLMQGVFISCPVSAVCVLLPCALHCFLGHAPPPLPPPLPLPLPLSQRQIGHLERAVHEHLGSDLNQVPVSSPIKRRFLIGVVSFVLLVFTTVLAFAEYMMRGGTWVWQSVFRGSR